MVGDRGERAVRREIRRLLGDRHLRMTPIDLVNLLSGRFPDRAKKRFHSTVRRMVAQGELVYTHHFNSTHIELGGNGTMRISDRLALRTAAAGRPRPSSSLALTLLSGCTFGRGDHPTTRLSLQALDWIFRQSATTAPPKKRSALDIGTGTGVLAMAATLLGVDTAVGVDIDRLACWEAMKNVRVNDLVGRVHIVAGDLQALRPVLFDMILANLRPPTLIGIMASMAQRTIKAGYWVLSGFRPEERSAILARLPNGFHPVWFDENRNWASIVVRNAQEMSRRTI